MHEQGGCCPCKLSRLRQQQRKRGDSEEQGRWYQWPQGKKTPPWWEMLASGICSAVTQPGKYVCPYNSWHDMQYSEGRELIPVPSLDGREPPGIIICEVLYSQPEVAHRKINLLEKNYLGNLLTYWNTRFIQNSLHTNPIPIKAYLETEFMTKYRILKEKPKRTPLTSTTIIVIDSSVLFLIALLSTTLLHLQLNVLFSHEIGVFSSVVCCSLSTSSNTQVSGIQFGCPLSLLLPGVKPWTDTHRKVHTSLSATEDHRWLLWGHDFTHVSPLWKATIKEHYLAQEFVCPDFRESLVYLYQSYVW